MRPLAAAPTGAERSNRREAVFGGGKRDDEIDDFRVGRDPRGQQQAAMRKACERSDARVRRRLRPYWTDATSTPTRRRRGLGRPLQETEKGFCSVWRRPPRAPGAAYLREQLPATRR